MKNLSSYLNESSEDNRIWLTDGGAPQVEIRRIRYGTEVEDLLDVLISGGGNKNYASKNDLDLRPGCIWRMNVYEYEDDNASDAGEMIGMTEYLLYSTDDKIISIGAPALELMRLSN